MDVVNGGCGRSVTALDSTESTRYDAPSSPAAELARAGFVEQRHIGVLGEPRRSAGRSPGRWRAGGPSTATSPAGKSGACAPARLGPAVANVPSRSQYVAARKAMRARSRSTTSRAATLWTRPADVAPPARRRATSDIS